VRLKNRVDVDWSFSTEQAATGSRLALVNFPKADIRKIGLWETGFIEQLQLDPLRVARA
jgi:hypothetical protein